METDHRHDEYEPCPCGLFMAKVMWTCFIASVIIYGAIGYGLYRLTIHFL